MGLRGPKKGAIYKPTLDKKAAQDLIYKFTMEHLDPILTALLERAKGVVVSKETSSGTKVYTEPPSPEAARILIEHAIGKPNSKIEHSGEGGGPVKISWEN